MAPKYCACLFTRHTPCNLLTEMSSNPSRRTFTKRQQTLYTTILVLRLLNFILVNFSSEYGTKEQQLAKLSKDLNLQACFLWSLPVLPTTHLAAQYFQVSNTQDQSPFTFLESSTPTGSPLHHSTSYVSAESTSKIDQEGTGKQKGVLQAPTSPHRKEKKMYTETSKQVTGKTPDSDSNFEETALTKKKKWKMKLLWKLKKPHRASNHEDNRTVPFEDSDEIKTVHSAA